MSTAVSEFKQDASGTITGVNRGTFELKKVLNPAATRPEGLTDGTTFPVKVTVDSPDDTFDETYTLDVLMVTW